MKTNETRLYELLLAMAVILFGMLIIGVGVEIYLKIKNDGQQTNKILIGTNK